MQSLNIHFVLNSQQRGLEAANIKACGFYYSIHENYSKPFKDALTKSKSGQQLQETA